MITIGLTTWSDHPALIENEDRKVSLQEYAGYFPTVEVDTPFYGIPRETTIDKWLGDVPEGFQFVMKANQVMTKHDVRKDPVSEDDRQRAFRDYVKTMRPMQRAGKLKTVLFQFPPFFTRNTANIQYLQLVRQEMGDYPITVEFRNPSWYDENLKLDLTAYLTSLNMTMAVVDEPHNLNDGVPFKPVVTTPDLALLRLHGQNQKGWFNQDKNWRKTRTLYRYSDQELEHFAQVATELAKQAKEVCIIFNNNSGHDAAPNALKLKDLLHLHWDDLAPQQLNLF
ncbi:DUF72 domain-containing protein [Levilactobacillus bambusae]|uniref:DUF72 domain-containing protein n=1 Tax=Levilactobacillus bambusae TaxID=2024736 RepID=A0A2V1MYW0_9LACO|nr:DUF72 domain-containing protein [Levilactobacillus bambusae]PWF99335.1 DUF72 domain-containing protein [Levilactobacillus bambusae]